MTTGEETIENILNSDGINQKHEIKLLSVKDKQIALGFRLQPDLYIV